MYTPFVLGSCSIKSSNCTISSYGCTIKSYNRAWRWRVRVSKCVYIFWTCANETEAKNVARELLEKRLIACASLVPGVTSLYRWEGKVEEDEEVKVILKSQGKHFANIRDFIQAESNYEVPEIVQVDISQGSPSYLAWIMEETCKS